MRRPVFVTGIHNAILYFAIIVLLHGSYVVLFQFFYECDVRVSEIKTVCQKPLNKGCGPVYSDAKSRDVDFGYLVGVGEVSAGDTVRKSKYGFAFEHNGKRANWQFLGFYLRLIVGSIFALVIWLFISRVVGKRMKP